MKKYLLFLMIFGLIQSVFAQDLIFNWANQYSGGGNNERATSIAVDGSGNVYTCGYFQGTVSFTPGNSANDKTSAGSNDIFITKTNSAGVLQWVKTYGSAGNDIANGITSDAAGNIWVIGGFTGTVEFGENGSANTNPTSAGNRDVFILKLNTNGGFLSVRAMGGGSDDFGNAIALDGSGNVLITGAFGGTADFDPGAGV